LVFHAYINEMHGSRSKIPSKKSSPYIYDVKFLALLGAPYIYDISRLRVNSLYMFQAGLLFIIRRYYCVYSKVCHVLCRLAASISIPILLAASRHKRMTYQLLYIQYLLMMSSKPARNM
jgi:hypothetical protein